METDSYFVDLLREIEAKQRVATTQQEINQLAALHAEVERSYAYYLKNLAYTQNDDRQDR
jgi:hypothetical protein